MMPGFFVASMAVLSADSTASNPELLKMVLPEETFFPEDRAVPDFAPAQRSNVIRLSSRASSALTAWGFPWPAAATPKAAVRSRYFLPSASQTLTPLAFSQTMGHEPSGSAYSTLRDSYSRRSWR